MVAISRHVEKRLKQERPSALTAKPLVLPVTNGLLQPEQVVDVVSEARRKLGDLFETFFSNISSINTDNRRVDEFNALHELATNIVRFVNQGNYKQKFDQYLDQMRAIINSHTNTQRE